MTSQDWGLVGKRLNVLWTVGFQSYVVQVARPRPSIHFDETILVMMSKSREKEPAPVFGQVVPVTAQSLGKANQPATQTNLATQDQAHIVFRVQYGTCTGVDGTARRQDLPTSHVNHRLPVVLQTLTDAAQSTASAPKEDSLSLLKWIEQGGLLETVYGDEGRE